MFFQQGLSQQYVALPQSYRNKIEVHEVELVASTGNYQALVKNIFKGSNLNNRLLITFRIFYTKTKKYKEVIGKSQLSNYLSITMDSLFTMAETNVTEDLQRDISFFEYHGDYHRNPIQFSNLKLIEENSDGTFTVYNTETYVAFFKVTAHKQFLSFQNSASQINTQALEQKFLRKKDLIGNLIVEWVKKPKADEWYYSNKLFIEKKNKNGIYHMVRLRQICSGCEFNYNQEFVFSSKTGVLNFWCYEMQQAENYFDKTQNQAYSKYLQFYPISIDGVQVKK